MSKARTDLTIPPAALEAGARAIHRFWFEDWAIRWDDLEPYDKDRFRTDARATFTAMVEHWPGMKMTPWWEFTTHKKRVDLILPLPEKRDAEA